MGCGASKSKPHRQQQQPQQKQSQQSAGREGTAHGHDANNANRSQPQSEGTTPVTTGPPSPSNSSSAEGTTPSSEATEVATETRSTRGQTHTGAPQRVSPQPSNEAHAASQPHLRKSGQGMDISDQDSTAAVHKKLSQSEPPLGDDSSQGSGPREHQPIQIALNNLDSSDQAAILSIQALARGILHRKVQAATGGIDTKDKRAGSVSPARTEPGAHRTPSPNRSHLDLSGGSASQGSSGQAGNAHGTWVLARQMSSPHIRRMSKSMFKGPVIPGSQPGGHTSVSSSVGGRQPGVTRTPSWHGRRNRISPSSNLSPSGSETSLLSSQLESQQ
eukprot:TRINITY_DN743_c0_g1_i1.p1 TRINITY_DN743_c0_g1~~TRINITY_DN743_c0_g1_i1.p1  ORF type:complete len:331 (+),score=10.95 TRINITY_DN743_c0_g1_i1:782-1774(+)